MLAIFGIGTTELIILGLIGAIMVFPLIIGIVVVSIVASRNNRPRE